MRKRKEISIAEPQPPPVPQEQPRPEEIKQKGILDAYDIIDSAVKQLVNQMPIEKHEMIYSMELERQTKIHLGLLVLGFAMMAIVLILSI